MRLLAAVPVFVAIGLAVACGDADNTGLRETPSGGGDDASAATGPLFGPGGARDAGQDRAPDFRDPKAGDGSCGAPNTVCSGACVSLNTDESHCGLCGRACQGGGTQCVGGTCQCTAIGMAYCDDAQGTGCRDVASDVNNCGSCGFVCDANLYDRCENSACLEPE